MRILIADDHDLVREMVGEILSRNGDTVVMAANVEESLKIVAAQESFDLIFLDYKMPGMNDLEGLKRVIEASDGTPVAIISGVANKAVAEKALAAGAIGFIPKTMKAKSLVNAVQFMSTGETFVPIGFMQAEDELPEAARAKNLTGREMEVVGGLCDGKSNKEIARDMDVQEVTIKMHVKAVTRKLEAKNRTHAAMIAKDLGLIGS